MAKMKINGTIVNNEEKWIYDLYEIEAFAPKDVYAVLDTIPEHENVDIEINSPGGYVTSGSEIYTALMQHKGEVNVTITGIAASMASVIAMAGTHITVSPTAQIMIHNASGMAGGDYRDLQHYSDRLKGINDTIANAYEIKTGMQKDKLLELMDAETWLTPDDCINYGFADEILSRESKVELQFVAGFEPKMLPPEVINKAKQDVELEKLNILKLKEI